MTESPRAWCRRLALAAAALLLPSTASRVSHETLSATSLDVDGGIGLSVNVRHFACVSIITLIASLYTMHADDSSEKLALFTNPIA